MTDPDLIEEIRERLRASPQGAIIDTLAWATELAASSSLSAEEIRNVVRTEASAAGVIVADP